MDFVKTEVLIIGGGIAGCFAAIRASEMGREVVLLEKATIRRSGSVGPGMDHVFIGVHPETITLEEAKEHAKACRKELMDPNVILAIYKEAYDRTLDLERFGIPVREDDGTYFIWKIPERKFYLVSYRGIDTKVKLAEAVRKTSTRVIERTMGVELLCHEGLVVGALGLNTRTGEITSFLAKATILCTGEAGRQYLEPDGPFVTYFPNTNTGDSEAMSYRAGAELANMEYIYMDYTSVRAGGGIAGIKPFDKMGYLVNSKGEKVLTKEHSTARGFVMAKELAEGRGPLYWDFRHLPEDVLAMYEREMSHEWPVTKEWLKQRGLDLRKDLIPIQLVPTGIIGGPIVDESCQTSVEGLYVAGAAAAYVMGLTEAAVCGHRAGESAARHAMEAGEPECDPKFVDNLKREIIGPLRRHRGANPIELEKAIRAITTDYVGYFKSGNMMQKGLDKLLELKDKYLSTVRAKGPHELMRCLEVRNISDLAEMHIRTSLMRTESRMRRVGLYPHYRVDYPKTDPSWEKWVVVKRENGKMHLFTKEIPALKEE
ncbi:MAG: FAD-binding protein [Deltaproteobacteria bacterium]|nr:FAD-binding protein [Deltaproteobacteria bacterium]MBW2138822.1 FAD-binding protein [Deltaproteobacteria bacterium]